MAYNMGLAQSGPAGFDLIRRLAQISWKGKIANFASLARAGPGLRQARYVARDYIQALCFARGLFSFPEFYFD